MNCDINIVESALLVSLFKKLKEKNNEKLDNALLNLNNVLAELNDIIISEKYIGTEGDSGDVGYTGSQGIIGYTGSFGYTGSKGVDGIKGIKGDQGNKGLIGYTGSKGIDGDDGNKGIDGKIGYSGSQGIVGYSGSQGVIGYTGSKGEEGDTGKIGYTGSIGVQGITGYTGSIGVQGITGYTGSKGVDGNDGKLGVIGYTGSKGVDGDISSLKNEVTEFISLAQNTLNELKNEADNKFSNINESNTLIENNLKKYLDKNDKGIKDFRDYVNKRLSIGWGEGTPGGSVRILDNEDVEFKKRHQVEGNAILIFDADKQKFVSESIESVIQRIQISLETQYNRLIETIGSVMYVGEALPGTLSNSASWRIKKIEDITNLTEIIWADGNSDFDKVWDDRLTYTYS